MRLPQCRAKQDNCLLCPANDADPDALQTQLALSAARAQLTDIQLLLTRSLFTVLLSSASLPSLHYRVAPSQALALVKLHMVGDCSSLRFVEVSLHSLSALEGVDSSSQFSMIGKLNIPSSPTSLLFMKILKSTGSKMGPAAPGH